MSAVDVAEAALRAIKAKCVGDALDNGWPLHPNVTRNRGVIADICDHAIGAVERDRAKAVAPDQENARS